MPPNTVSVCRPGRWGNPFSVAEYGRELAVANHRRRLESLAAIGYLNLDDLRGKNLACWCALLDKNGNKVHCHADTLLELANIDVA